MENNTNKKADFLGQEAYDRALRYEHEIGCCPQCVLLAAQETIGIPDDATIQAVHGLSGGGGLCGEGTCGALAGALVVLGARYGRGKTEVHRGRFLANFKKCKEVVDRFRAEFGGITCHELQVQFTGRTWDIWDAEQYKAFKENRGDRCAEATATVTRWVVEMISRG